MDQTARATDAGSRDDETADLAAVVHRISQLPMSERMKQRADLGETMVIAHAGVAAEAGEDVTVLIDDVRGAEIATLEINRLQRRKASGDGVGTLRLVKTLTVLERAAGSQYLPDRNAMRDTYERLRALDDGLPPIGRTNLLAAVLWS